MSASAIGRPAQAECGAALSPGVIDFCASVFAAGGAIFCGPGGGRFVYDLRAHFALYCKLTPVRHLAAIDDASILRPERLDGVDLIVVRENAGGFYFGRSEMRPGEDLAATRVRQLPLDWPARPTCACGETRRHPGHQRTVDRKSRTAGSRQQRCVASA
jgi:hypothetical protein